MYITIPKYHDKDEAASYVWWINLNLSPQSFDIPFVTPCIFCQNVLDLFFA